MFTPHDGHGPANSNPHHVLLVDDDSGMLETLADIFRYKGLGLTISTDGRQALEAACSTHVGCVIMDIRMPNMDGICALKRIKECRPDLPVIMMTAYAEKEKIREAMACGAHAVLPKPLDIENMLATITELFATMETKGP